MDKENIKLPVLNILKDAFFLTKENALSFSRKIFITGFLLMVLDVIDQKQYFSNNLLSIPVSIVMYLLIFTLFAVTVHRVTLLGKQSVPDLGVLSYSSREWRFVWWSTIIFVYFILVFFILAFLIFILFGYSDSGFGFGFLEFLFVLSLTLAFYFFARLSILFPAIAIEKKVGWNWAFEATKNNGWRLVVIVGAFPIAVGFVPNLLFDINVFLDIILIFFNLVLLVFEITALSISFKYLSSHDDNDQDGSISIKEMYGREEERRPHNFIC